MIHSLVTDVWYMMGDPKPKDKFAELDEPYTERQHNKLLATFGGN
jgi:hypothetical protein